MVVNIVQPFFKAAAIPGDVLPGRYPFRSFCRHHRPVNLPVVVVKYAHLVTGLKKVPCAKAGVGMNPDAVKPGGLQSFKPCMVVAFFKGKRRVIRINFNELAW